MQYVPTSGTRAKILTISTISFICCFAVWTIFSIIGIKIKAQLGLSETEFALLIATPILTGSLSRLILGIWTDQYGGRKVYTCLMITASIATCLLTKASTYPMFLLAALGVGLAGGSFAVGITYVSTWYPKEQQGTALGIFGLGNFGAAVTNFIAPLLLIKFGWHKVAEIYACMLFCMAILFFFIADEDPSIRNRQTTGTKAKSIMEQMSPLKHLQVWRFALYYFFVFGAFVALALWLPRYYIGAYGLDLITAGWLTFMYSMPGSIFRALGGWCSDIYGARKVMYITFLASIICLFFLSYPSTDYIIHGFKGEISFSIKIGLTPFVILTIILGFFMSLGKAAVYKHIPVYYPESVGAVGGVVGLVGGLGGFILPICFGLLNDFIGIWTSCFMALFIITVIAFLWMHLSIRKLEHLNYPELKNHKYLPELETINESK